MIGWIAWLLSASGMIAGILAVPLLIFFLFKAHMQSDLAMKKKYKRKALLSVLAPFVLIFSGVILFSVASVIASL